MEAQFLTRAQIAQRFQKTTRTIDRWCREGVLPCVKLGVGRNSRVMFNWEDVRRHVNEKFGFNLN